MSKFLRDDDIQALREGGAIREKMIGEIVAEVSDATGIPADEITGTRGKPHVSRARQVVMYVAWRNGFTKSEIGRALGRDHTTVMHGVCAEAGRRAAGRMQ